MSLTEAVSFLKGAVPKGGSYIFSDHVVYADARQTTGILAAHPVPHIGGEFALSAQDLEKAIARLPSEPEILNEDGRMVLKAGRLKSSIDLIPVDAPFDPPDTTREPVPTTLIESLATAAQFSADGMWQSTIHLGTDRVLATMRGVLMVEVAVPNLKANASLPADVARYLISSEPTEWSPREDGATFFRGDAYVSCQFSTMAWPDGMFDNLVDRVGDTTPVSITDDWRQALDDIAFLGDGAVIISPQGMRGKTSAADHAVEFPTGVSRETTWSVAALRPLFAVATSWNPDGEGGISPFVGPNIRGVVAGMR